MEQNITNKIIQIVRDFETGKTTGADYGCISKFNDGPDNRLQLTYGASQTTEYGNLKELVQMYITAGGLQASNLSPYVNLIGSLNRPSLATSDAFLSILKSASADPIMHMVQDAFFMKDYFNPALNWFTENGFTLPLSLLVIYDSFVQSGGILGFLRNKFSEAPPATSHTDDEKNWITDYVHARDAWLENSVSRPILEHTVYRTDSFILAIQRGNWDLSQPFQVCTFSDEAKTQPVFREMIA